MLLDELVKVHRIHVVTIRAGESCDVARRNGISDPLSELPPFLGSARQSAPLRNPPQPPETLSRQRTEHEISDSKKSAPGNGVVMRESLTHFRKRNSCEIQHCLRSKQIEVGHCLIGTRNYEIDLVSLARERGILPGQRFG